MKDDMISREALRRKVQKVAVEAWKLKMTASVETVMNQFLDFLEQAPSVPAVPLDRLCEWLTANRVSIPCRSCEYYDAGKCTVQNDMSKPCPNTTRDWQRAITKWMEASE